MSENVRAYSPTAAHRVSTEEGRAFLQERIALFSKTSFLLSLFFLLGGNAITVASRGHFYIPLEHSNLWHVVGAAIALITWVALRKLPALSYSALVAIDAAAVLLSLGAYATMSASVLMKAEFLYGSGLVIARMDLFIVLISLLVLMLRAVLVPATVRHTAFVSVAGLIPSHALTWFLLSNFDVGDPPVTPLMGLLSTGMWGAVAVIVASYASRVIYGLHVQVRAAEQLGQYLLEEKIGEGGMGTVYRARHALLRRPTAVKLLRPESSGGETLSRFEQEVQLTSRLTHPNTVAIFDYGHTPEGVFYYAMEYLDGIDLEELVMRHGPQPPARVVHVLAQVCGSLAEAHQVGLVHRDIKPANIILCERGGMPDVAKVVDFGLVKQLKVGKDVRVTTADAVLGTPLYLAPEAIKDPDSVDGRADLYALGAVAYFLLTGSPVFDAPTVVEVCAKHLHEPPIPPSARLDKPLPFDLESVVLRCLAKDPDARFSNATALREALLGCDIEAWSDDDARGWWADHAAFLPRPPKEPTHGALTIALEDRPDVTPAA